MCGIFGVIAKYNRPDLAVLISQGLYQQQNRGDFSAGMAVIKKFDMRSSEFEMARRIAVEHGSRIYEPLTIKKGEGKVTEVFSEKDLEELVGIMGVGQVRYPTAGYTIPKEHENLNEDELKEVRQSSIQPLKTNITPDSEPITMVHNGDIHNFTEIMDGYRKQGIRQSTHNDLEALLKVFTEEFSRIAETVVERHERVASALEGTMNRVKGTYSALGMINNFGLFAFRDNEGRRPLFYGVLRNDNEDIVAYGFASETTALERNGFKGTSDKTYASGKHQYEEVNPGELMFVDKDFTIHKKQIVPANPKPCPFEISYFARGSSFFHGTRVKTARQRIIQQMWKEFEGTETYKKIMEDKDNIIITSVPRTADSAALELANITGLKYTQAIEKHPHSSRIFQQVNQDLRESGTMQDHYIYPEEVRGKTVIVIDDSIVRGTTLFNHIKYFRNIGVKGLHIFITFEPIRKACYHAIDFHTNEELVGHDRSREEIKTAIGLKPEETLMYATMQQIANSVDDLQGTFCNSCYMRN